MKKKILLIPLALLLAISLVATGCPAPVVEPGLYEEYVAGLAEGEFPVPREAFEQAVEEGKLYLYDWAGWWPEEIFSDFEEEFGIDVTRDHFASADEIKAKFTLDPETPYDLIITGGKALQHYLREAGALGQLNYDWMPNLVEYIPEELQWREGVPYGLTVDAYIYNTKFVDDPRIPSWAVLLDPLPEVKGKIALKDTMHETIGLTLKYLGYNFFSDDEAELMEARDLLVGLKPDIMVFDDWPETLALADEVWVAHWMYGGGVRVHAEYEALVPVLPTEGAMARATSMHYTIGSPNPAAVHLFLNYLFRPEVMARLIEIVKYTPVHTAMLELLPEEVREAVTIPAEYLAEKVDYFDPRAYAGEGLELRIQIWEEVKR